MRGQRPQRTPRRGRGLGRNQIQSDSESPSWTIPHRKQVGQTIEKKNSQCNRFVMIETFKHSPGGPLCQTVCLFAQQATPEYQVVLHSAGCGLAVLYSSRQSTSHTICLLCALHGFIMKPGVNAGRVQSLKLSCNVST